MQADNLSDEEIASLAAKDQELFLHIVKRYKAKLLRYIIRISGLDPEAAEDVLQDVFIKVYQNLNDFDSGLKFSSWIYRIAHNQVISNFRKIQARPQKAGFDLDDDMIKNIASELDLQRDLDARILETRIAAVLDRLKPKYRDALVLRFLEEKSYEEISDIMRKPVGTVGSLINRAKKEFRATLEAEGGAIR